AFRFANQSFLCQCVVLMLYRFLVGRRLLHRVHLLPAWSRGRELRACPLCPFRSVPVREMALECVFQKKVEKSKMRPSARRGRAQRKCKKYLDVLTVHTHSRNIPLAEHSFF